MSTPDPAELAIDAFVDRLLRGEALDVEQYAAEHPELAAPDLARLRKLARVLGRGAPLGAPLRAAAGEPPARAPLERLGPYRLIERLGAGGMGIVYLAEDERLGRRVALKLVRPELAGSPSALARFEREARTIARLRHESIVTVFEAGREGETPYLAMEFVAGENLDEKLAAARGAQQHVPLEAVLGWARDIARGLAAAHAAGIVHRDVKPSNVRITDQGRALLLDFGLAFDPDSASLSRTGEVHGTMFYVSPEQVAGGAAKVDARTDVWSLGVTLYEALTGHRPFDGAHSQEVLYRILTRDPVGPRALEPDLPRDVENVVLMALEKDRERRYASAAALADDLEALLEHRPTRARPTGALTRALKWSRRKPAHATALVLASLLLLGGPLTWALVRERHTRELGAEKRLADEQRRLAEARAGDLEEMAKFQGDVLARVEPPRMAQHMLAALRDEARAAALAAGLDEARTAQRLAELERALEGANTTNVAVRSLREDVLEPALATAHERFAARPSVLGMLLHTIGGTAWSLGLSDLALDAQQQAWAVLAAHPEAEERDRCVVRANLGYYLFAAGDAEQAEPHLRAGAEGLARIFGAEDGRTLSARHNLALLLRARGQNAEAEALVREVLEARRRTLGPDDPDTLVSLSNLGAVLLVQERREEAEPLLRAAYEGRRRVLGPGSDATLTSANNLAVLYKDLERLADAEALLREAYDAARASLGDRHPTTSFLRTGWAELLVLQGCHAEAVEPFTRSVELGTELSGPLHPDTLYAVARLGSLLRRLGRWSEAEALLGERWSLVDAVHPDLPRPTRDTAQQWALLLREQGRFEEAAAIFTRLVAAWTAELGPLHERTQRLRTDLLATWTRARRFEQAARLAAEVPVEQATEPFRRAAQALYTAWSAADPARDVAAELQRWRDTSR